MIRAEIERSAEIIQFRGFKYASWEDKAKYQWFPENPIEKIIDQGQIDYVKNQLEIDNPKLLKGRISS
jgi:hypothetical protein